jgi:hypothetical protein
MANLIKYEYTQVISIDPMKTNDMNEYGLKGWELISHQQQRKINENHNHYIFKRPILMDEDIPDWVKQHEEQALKQ